jgi:hypothetical protein
MTTPKMAGLTPGTMSFSPALLGQSPSQLLYGKHRSPAFNSPDLAGIGGGGSGAVIGGAMSQVQMAGDESKKKELGDILKLLAMRPGRISEEGVERLAKRMGLDCYKDSNHGVTTMSLAAKIFLLDV